MHSCFTSVCQEFCPRGDVPGPGGVYLVLGGVPGTWSGGVPGQCTWSRGVYLVLGGVPGPGGCTWSGGVPGPASVHAGIPKERN